jgi:cytochrome c peroxidase
VHGRTGRRNAPAIVNRGYGSTFFWDGRVSSLEALVLEPIQDSLEMDLPVGRAVARLQSDPDYRAAFASAFRDDVSIVNLARALASYVRTIRSGNAPFDRYREGDTTAISPAARRGAVVFFGRGNCSACHLGPNFTDEGFHNTGIEPERMEDGRYALTGMPGDRGAFKTPTIREVSSTAPYMHDGSIGTLEAVVDFYVQGGHPNPNLDPEIRPLRLRGTDRADLVAFLRSLSSESITCAPIGCAP